jgi:hypothetical protein
MPEIKIGFESCLSPEPTEITFIGKNETYIGKVKLRALSREEVFNLKDKPAEEQLVASIEEWDFKDKEGNLLEINVDSIKRLNNRILTELAKAMNNLAFGDEVTEKN